MVGWVCGMLVGMLFLMLMGNVDGEVLGVCVVEDIVMGINMFSNLVVVEWIGWCLLF